MAGLSPVKLLASWTEASRDPYGERLARLIGIVDGSATVAEDTVGQRNCRLLRLHCSLAGTPLEANVACPRCATENEFLLPTEAILAAPEPSPDLRVKLRVSGSVLTFRLPRMTDIDSGGRETVVARCRVAGKGTMTKAAIERLGRKFERLDPAANVVVRLNCSHCGHRIDATVDVATFVGRELDRIFDRLLREVDVVATAYGWSEASILALPARRRQLYTELIARRTSRPARSMGAQA